MAERKIELVDEKGLARIFICSLAKVRKDRYAGVGVPYLKFGKKVLYDMRAVEKHLESIGVATKNNGG